MVVTKNFPWSRSFSNPIKHKSCEGLITIINDTLNPKD